MSNPESKTKVSSAQAPSPLVPDSATGVAPASDQQEPVSGRRLKKCLVALVLFAASVVLLTGAVFFMWWLASPRSLELSLRRVPSRHARSGVVEYDDGQNEPVRGEGYFESMSNLSITFNNGALSLSKKQSDVLVIGFGDVVFEVHENNSVCERALGCGEAAIARLYNETEKSLIVRQLPRLGSSIAAQIGAADKNSLATMVQFTAASVANVPHGTLTADDVKQANAGVDANAGFDAHAEHGEPPAAPGSRVFHAKEKYCPRNKCDVDEPYRKCDNKCYGMCGNGCNCWKAICGDCRCHLGCEKHDYYCSCKSMAHPYCLSFAAYFFGDYHPCSGCRG